jgi:hypothetical protein
MTSLADAATRAGYFPGLSADAFHVKLFDQGILGVPKDQYPVNNTIKHFSQKLSKSKHFSHKVSIFRVSL